MKLRFRTLVRHPDFGIAALLFLTFPPLAAIHFIGFFHVS